ncbi:Alpha/Beta hydrolase protein [Blastocladiella britannica]|nr:Alpha/Beta hydrolase protein [Blastocladiella britannica]
MLLNALAAAAVAMVVLMASSADASPPSARSYMADQTAKNHFSLGHQHQQQRLEQHRAPSSSSSVLGAPQLPNTPFVPMQDLIAAALAHERATKARNSRTTSPSAAVSSLFDIGDSVTTTTTTKYNRPPVHGPAPRAPVFWAKEQYRVHALPGIDLASDEYALYAGHMIVDEHGSTEFFMYFERTDAPSDDLIMWTNGGPGASSLFGLFVENGPLAFDSQGKIVHNTAGWHRAGNVLFIENPAGVGFSTVTDDRYYPKTIHAVGEMFWTFTQHFTAVFGGAERTALGRGEYKWWLTGESFGGMYVPHIADHILQHNGKLQSGDHKINLKGIAVGNGAFFSPVDIPVNWVDYFSSRGLLREPKRTAELMSLRSSCSSELADPVKFKNRDLPHCVALTSKFTDPSYVYAVTRGAHCLSTFYDVRVTACNQGDPTDPYNAFTAAYLNRADVQKALHASFAPVEWTWLSFPVYERLYWNGDEPSYLVLPKLVSKGVKVLIYNGDADIICNFVGNEMTLSQLRWGGDVGFGKGARLQPYLPNGRSAAGAFIKARGLSYVRIFEAGHMVPFNQPEASLAMMQQFVGGSL